MSEQTTHESAGALWRSQAQEPDRITLEHFVDRRTRELDASTQSETLMSIGAVVFLVGIVAWRFTVRPTGAEAWALGLATAWVLVSVYRFQDRFRNRAQPEPDAMADKCSSFYRRQLERRRDHLRNAWVWHGPLVLACLVLSTIAIGKAFPGYARLLNVAPLIVLLVIWTAFGLRNRRLQAAQLQREIDECENV